jgi:hypothetical protein
MLLALLALGSTADAALYGVYVAHQSTSPSDPATNQLASVKIKAANASSTPPLPPSVTETNIGAAYTTGAIGRATGMASRQSATIYHLSTDLQYHARIEGRSLADGTSTGVVPLDLPFVFMAGFGQQMGVYTTKAGGEAAIVIAPAANSTDSSFPYSAWTVDLAANTTTPLGDLGTFLVTQTMTKGFAADVDDAGGRFFFLIGDPKAQATQLVGVDVASGKVVVQAAAQFEDCPEGLVAIAWDPTTKALYAAGLNGDGYDARPALYMLDESGAAPALKMQRVFPALGSGFSLMPLPGIATFVQPSSDPPPPPPPSSLPQSCKDEIAKDCHLPVPTAGNCRKCLNAHNASMIAARCPADASGIFSSDCVEFCQAEPPAPPGPSPGPSPPGPKPPGPSPPTPTPPTPTPPSPGSCGNKEFDQCGGDGWTGETCCPDGEKCQSQSQYYSQCVPASAGGGKRRLSPREFDAALVVPASQPRSSLSEVNLILLPIHSAWEAELVPYFCTVESAVSDDTCPKLLRWAPATTGARPRK